MKYKTEINTAAISWSNEGHPHSNDFDDVYYSTSGGLDESRHVFIAGNNLEARLLNRTEPFYILETGFGTGLNFLACLKLWTDLELQIPLHFVSIEAFPLSAQQLHKALQPWLPYLNDEITLLLAAYSDLKPGSNILKINGHITLQLIVTDAKDFKVYQPAIDAVFLDGFSPTNNPEMWTEALFDTIYKSMKSNASLATYTVAGSVKRALKAAGFEIKKLPGHGKKREMLSAFKPPAK